MALTLISLSLLGSGALAQASRAVPGDYIVAVVNSEPITHAELNAAVKRAQDQYKTQRRDAPPEATVRQQVLESLINEKAQLQHAIQAGIRVDDASLDQAERNVAQQNQTDLEGLTRLLARDGLTRAAFREQLKEQILVSRVREREVNNQVRISDQDVERYLQERQTSRSDPFTHQINLAQILVVVPEKASAEQAAQLYLQAQKIQARAVAGEDFTALVNQYSGGDKANGGQIGLRPASRYPTAFVQATAQLAVGGVSGVVRSGAGFHILKVVERQIPESFVQTLVQTRARHILLRTGPELSQAAALARMADYRQRIVSGRATFDRLAREVSQDGSAAQGGDLGWVNPGMFVPEFESVMDRLEENEISPPTVSRFGVHLIQVLDRRRVALSPAETRELARNVLREIKTEEAYTTWAREIRERAFVELREAPQR